MIKLFSKFWSYIVRKLTIKKCSCSQKELITDAERNSLPEGFRPKQDSSNKCSRSLIE